MKHVITATLIAAGVAGCTGSEPTAPQPDLTAWRTDHAAADVAAAIADRDYSLLSMNGIGPYVPGIDRRNGWPTVNGHDAPTECIGGGDAIEPGQLPAIRAMEAYATRYNQLMAAYLAAHPRLPTPATASSSRQ